MNNKTAKLLYKWCEMPNSGSYENVKKWWKQLPWNKREGQRRKIKNGRAI